MHPMRIREALRKWDETQLARALRDVVVDVTGLPCVPEVERDISWACRDLLWGVRQSPFPRSSTTPVPDVALTITYTLHTRPKKRIEVRVGSTDEARRQRLIDLGLDLHAVEVSRDEVDSPPWHGEAGWIASPSPHIVRAALAPHQTYAHALKCVASHPPGPLHRQWEAGERTQTWASLEALGESARDDERRLADIMHVLTAWAATCARHLRALTDQLCRLGLRVAPPETDGRAIEHIGSLEERVGPLPLTVCAWHQLVGAVDLRGFQTETEYEAWAAPRVLGPDIERADPLVLEPSSRVFSYDESLWWQGVYALRVAPDIAEKFFAFGGAPLAVAAPTGAVDSRMRDELFATYIRRVLAWAGYPEVDIPSLRALRARFTDI